jgi:hypothetical protein
MRIVLVARIRIACTVVELHAIGNAIISSKIVLTGFVAHQSRVRSAADEVRRTIADVLGKNKARNEGDAKVLSNFLCLGKVVRTNHTRALLIPIIFANVEGFWKHDERAFDPLEASLFDQRSSEGAERVRMVEAEMKISNAAEHRALCASRKERLESWNQLIRNPVKHLSRCHLNDHLRSALRKVPPDLHAEKLSMPLGPLDLVTNEQQRCHRNMLPQRGKRPDRFAEAYGQSPFTVDTDAAIIQPAL